MREKSANCDSSRYFIQSILSCSADQKYSSAPVLGIRIRMFLGFPDPDPLVRGMDQDLSFSHKCVERTKNFLRK